MYLVRWSRLLALCPPGVNVFGSLVKTTSFMSSGGGEHNNKPSEFPSPIGRADFR